MGEVTALAKVRRVRSFKAGKYGKGLIQSEAAPQAMIWRVGGGWNGDPHHAEISQALKIHTPNVAFHIDKQRRFYFHSQDQGFEHPKDPAKLAAHVHRQYPNLTWGKLSAEEYETQHGLREGAARELALGGRPLRDFERGAHLHVLDWSHQTARYRFGAAGQVQVKAAAKAIAHRDMPYSDAPPTLPSLEAALHGELRKLYAVGHATVTSELDHQASGQPLPVGLSAAPSPPHLRRAKSAKRSCATCKMFDQGICWGYGNHPVKPSQVCDSWAPEQGVKQLAASDRGDPGRLRARARVAAADVAHLIWQAIQRARLQGITSPKRLRQIGREAGAQGLRQAASHHAGGAINAGRHAAATIHTRTGIQEVVGARYTSVLDKSSCAECVAADDGVLRSLDDPALPPVPNPSCAGGDRCRCLWIYQLASETRDPPYAAVGVGAS